MRCEEAALELLDDVGTPSDEVLLHARHCKECHQLASAHRSALRLRGAQTILPPIRGSLPVQRWWRRRLALRGAVAMLAAAGAGALALTWSGDEEKPASVIAVAPVQDVKSLLLEVDSYTQERIPAEDATLAPFGEVPGLLGSGITTVGIRERTQP